MLRISIVVTLAAALGCAHARSDPAPASTVAPDGSVLRAPELPRVRCLLVAPFENASDAPAASDAATAALLSAIDPARTRVFPVAELRAVFKDTALELPRGIAPSLALELAELVGADAALHGAVEGRAGGRDPDLVVSVRLALTGDRHLLFARTASIRAAPGETTEAAVRRTMAELARPMIARLGYPGRKRCFDPERTQALRKFALSQSKAPPTGRVAPAPAPTAQASPAASPARAQTRTPRQAEWSRRIAAGERIMIEDATFAGRTAQLQRDGGLADLAIALAAAPDAKVRLEAFVDATEPGADRKLSAAMAQAAGERLVQLGVERARISWSGRGGESPLLPNFTVRGRAANRRIEAEGVR
jgi:outer membrane protein OmpA-like peptidoglycan-associated protein